MYQGWTWPAWWKWDQWSQSRGPWDGYIMCQHYSSITEGQTFVATRSDTCKWNHKMQNHQQM
jgi:hypothetical protein